MTNTQTRRSFLTQVGCCLAASPLVTPVALAAAPGDKRLVVIILRGAMDGLDVVRPLGDRDFAALRPNVNMGDALPLNDFFGLHPGLAGLHPLWAKGELGFVHATSTPYRDKRSHFDGQDLLEAGIGPGGAIRDGWLNRALSLMPGTQLRTGFAVGGEDALLMHGDAPVSTWAPDAVLTLSTQSKRLLGRMYHDAPLFAAAMDEAVDLAGTLQAGGGDIETYGEMREAMGNAMQATAKGSTAEKLAQFTAERLLEDTRIASFSLGGWDTHNGQARALRKPLAEFERAILTLRDGLGPAAWGQTAVLAMTEFGRTARENGSQGTDHGTAGAMVLAGGAVRGGMVHGDWPGLANAQLYKERDLMPTSDLRAHAGTALAGLFGLAKSDLEAHIFPGLDMSAAPGILR